MRLADGRERRPEDGEMEAVPRAAFPGTQGRPRGSFANWVPPSPSPPQRLGEGGGRQHLGEGGGGDGHDNSRPHVPRGPPQAAAAARAQPAGPRQASRGGARAALAHGSLAGLSTVCQAAPPRPAPPHRPLFEALGEAARPAEWHEC